MKSNNTIDTCRDVLGLLNQKIEVIQITHILDSLSIACTFHHENLRRISFLHDAVVAVH